MNNQLNQEQVRQKIIALIQIGLYFTIVSAVCITLIWILGQNLMPDFTFTKAGSLYFIIHLLKNSPVIKGRKW